MTTDVSITVNGKTATCADGATVSDVLAQFDVTADTAGVAVAVNGAVVPRRRWRDVSLSRGDTIEVIHAVQGG